MANMASRQTSDFSAGRASGALLARFWRFLLAGHVLRCGRTRLTERARRLLEQDFEGAGSCLLNVN